jgi:hypothetical protein
MQDRSGGGILPLGGEGEVFGGHKGYGLAVMVDILCAALSGASMGPSVFDTATSRTCLRMQPHDMAQTQHGIGALQFVRASGLLTAAGRDGSAPEIGR